MKLPRPSLKLTGSFDAIFEPCPEMIDHIKDTLLSPTHAMYNKDHEHFALIEAGFLFTNVDNNSKGRRILGQAKLAGGGGDRWASAMMNSRLFDWFGSTLDALVVIDGVWWSGATELQRYALLEHEMYHISHKTNEFGEKQYSDETGKPQLTMRGHDVEEFIDVVARYGSYSPDLIAMKIAMSREPKFTIQQIDGICGSCKKKVS